MFVVVNNVYWWAMVTYIPIIALGGCIRIELIRSACVPTHTL